MPRSVRESIRNVRTLRRWWRRAGRARNRLLGRPDAWDDLLKVCRRIRPGAVLDVGAHVGRMVERFADELADVPIHAFEPTPETAKPNWRNTSAGSKSPRQRSMTGAQQRRRPAIWLSRRTCRVQRDGW